MPKSVKFEKYQPVIIAFASLCIFFFAIFEYTQLSNDKKVKDIRDQLLDLMITKKSQLEKALSSRIYYTKGIAAYCSINPDISNDTFYKLADELINKDSVISSMSLSKDCILNAIYPFKGHEAAIGLNLLEHPLRRKIVESTIKTRNTFVAGPVNLVEGGVAFISYTPIFNRTLNDSSKFWGVTDIVILKNKLFNEIKLIPQDGKYKYALRGNDGTGLNGACFWGDEDVFKHNPVTVDVILPTGNWTLASVPVNGWGTYLDKTEQVTAFLYLSAFIISLLIWQLSKAIIKIRAHEKELKALFGSMQDLIIEFGKNGEYLKIAPTNDSLLIRPMNELLGKSLHQVFDKATADYFLDGIRKCIETRQMVVLDYPLEINNKNFWFEARITRLSDNSVIYVAHDNTLKRQAEEHLRQSEQKLKELNATKDKFFSIIAHDLRGPFSGFMGITDELKTNIDDLDKEEIRELAGIINSSAKSTYELLTNLLEWSGLQTGRIEYLPSEVRLSVEIEKINRLFASAASLKSISITSEVDPDIIAMADRNMLNAVLRNLVSNAIKFTQDGGKILLSSDIKDDFVELSVADSGIGMSEENMKKVFRIDSGFTTKGTNGEKGSGLGLVLCKELVEKHNGHIKISSTPSVGTTITFSLPLVTDSVAVS